MKKFAFSLIESAVVLAVAGSVIGGGLKAYQATNPKQKSDLKKMEAIENALQQYFTTNGRLPFPAHPQKGPADANYLQAIGTTVYNASVERYTCGSTNAIADGGATHVDCANRAEHCCPGDFVLWGVVPTRTLGLPDDYAYDSYGHNFEYITHSALAYENGAPFGGGYSKANYTTNQSGTYKVLFKHSTSPNIYVPLEKLAVNNNATGQVIPATTNNTAYVLISKGNTNKCYFNAKASKIETAKPTGNLLKNCVQNYANNSNIDRTIYQGYSKSFDNLVRYKTLNDMIARASNMQEDARTLGQSTTQYQLKIDQNLITNSKEVVGAINEVEEKVKFVSTFNGVRGIRAQLYYLYTEEDNISVNGQKKHYRRGLYIYNENVANPSLSDFKLVSGSGGGVPVGSVVAYSGKATTAPEGFLWCNGAKYNKLTYPELYQAIGETYTPASEKGGTTFRVPDLTDKIPWQSGSLSGSKAVGTTIAAGVPNITGKLGQHVYSNRDIWVNCAWSADAFSCGANAEPGNRYYSDYTSGVINNTNYTYFNANNGASTKGIYRSDAKTVQPPAISMKFMIRYTADQAKAKEVFDFSEEVRRQLAQSIMTEEIKKAICEKSYPVGSVYRNYSDARNPNAILGCGTWADLGSWKDFAFYLGVRHSNLNAVIGINTSTSSASTAAMPFSTSCLPNIKGSMDSAFQGYPKWHNYSGAITGKDWHGDNSWEDNTGGYTGFSLDASKTNTITQGIYKDACKKVIPDTLWVYTWVRKA